MSANGMSDDAEECEREYLAQAAQASVEMCACGHTKKSHTADGCFACTGPACDFQPRSTLNGDGPCTECGATENIVWHTQDMFWNNVVRKHDSGFNGYFVKRWGGEPILCLPCFVRIAEERGWRPVSWRVEPVWPMRKVAINAEGGKA